MDATIWAKAHGAAVHFPIALALGSCALDAGAFALGERPLARDLHTAGHWMIGAGALGSLPAVISGLVMERGSMLGHGALRLHHLFVWPAFALIVGLAAWRMCTGRRATRPMFAAYLVVAALMAGLMSAAGYWGGEMMISG
jgi:uncharacterized membrane protein